MPRHHPAVQGWSRYRTINKLTIVMHITRGVLDAVAGNGIESPEEGARRGGSRKSVETSVGHGPEKDLSVGAAG